MFGRRRRDESDDLRAFIREIVACFDRGMAHVDARLEKEGEASRRRHEEVMAHQAADRERLQEVLAEGRAQRQALFRILDRLDGGGGAAAAG